MFPTTTNFQVILRELNCDESIILKSGNFTFMLEQLMKKWFESCFEREVIERLYKKARVSGTSRLKIKTTEKNITRIFMYIEAHSLKIFWKFLKKT